MTDDKIALRQMLEKGSDATWTPPETCWRREA
jgi:hypothetical protein